MTKIGQTSTSYFGDLVDSIVQREIADKWLDVTGEARRPLLTIEEHHQLLSVIAMEMLAAGTTVLNRESLEFATQLFCESKSLAATVSRQVLSRIYDHPLIAKVAQSAQYYSFDHDEFREYFLGEGLAALLLRRVEADLRSLLRKAILPARVIDVATACLIDKEPHMDEAVRSLLQIVRTEPPSSYARENCGGLIMEMIKAANIGNVTVHDVLIGTRSFSDCTLTGVTFSKAYVRVAHFNECALKNCTFKGCRFETIQLGRNVVVENCAIEGCEIFSIINDDPDSPAVYDPSVIIKTLEAVGFRMNVREEEADTVTREEQDERIALLTRALRAFHRSTGVNDDLFRLRLSDKAGVFEKEVLPDLLEHGILQETNFRGQGRHKRYRLSVPMSRINSALIASRGDYARLLKEFPLV